MKTEEVIRKIDAIVQYYHPWENDGGETRDEYLKRILEQYANGTYPNYKKGGAEFCGKCGTTI